MTYPVSSKHFRYFFQFLQLQVEETYFFHHQWSLCYFHSQGQNLWTEIQLKSIYILPIFTVVVTYSIHPFSNFSYFFQFLRLQVEENYFFLEAIAVSGFTSHGRNKQTAIKYSYSAHFAVVSLVLRIKASCKGKYLLNHPFQPFFQFLPLQVEETYFFRDGLNRGLIRFLPPGGRNLPTLASIHMY